MLDEIQFAARTSPMTNETLFRMVTSVPAEIFKLDGCGIDDGSRADLFLLPAKTDDYFENLFEAKLSDMQLVIVGGNIHLRATDLASTTATDLHEMMVDGETKLVKIDVASLRKRILKKVPASWLSKNQLWNIIE